MFGIRFTRTPGVALKSPWRTKYPKSSAKGGLKRKIFPQSLIKKNSVEFFVP